MGVSSRNLDKKKHSVVLPESNIIFSTEKKIEKDLIRNKINQQLSRKRNTHVTITERLNLDIHQVTANKLADDNGLNLVSSSNNSKNGAEKPAGRE